MKDVFNRTTNSIIVSSIIAGILGIVMLIYPNISLKTIGLIAAIYIIINGLVLIVLDIKAARYYIPFDGMLPGILSLVLGVILLSKPNILSTLFTIAIGVWIVLASINSLKIAIALRYDDAPWLLLLLFGIIDLILGIIVVINPFEASLSIVVFTGIMLIIHSIIDIVDMLIIKRDAKKITKIIENSLKEI